MLRSKVFLDHSNIYKILILWKHGRPGSGTDWSESVQDFQNFAGFDPVQGFEILSWSLSGSVLEASILLVLVRSETA